MLHGSACGAAPGDASVAAVAQRQHGVVSTAQLHACGLDRNAIAYRVRRRRLLRIHHGVYAVGHTRLTSQGRHWAALLACGGPVEAALSHRTAAALWELLPSPAGRVEVTTRRHRTSPSGLRVHQSATLAEDVVLHHGLAVTSPTRTLVDLADVLAPDRLTRVLHRAEIVRVLDARALQARLHELPGRRTRALSAALTDLGHLGPDHTRSELEERFLALIAPFGLPPPRVNATVAGYEVDFLWPRQRVVAETDGAATHATRSGFEADRRRDLALLLAGYRVVRFTWRQVAEEPRAVAHALQALLSARS